MEKFYKQGAAAGTLILTVPKDAEACLEIGLLTQGKIKKIIVAVEVCGKDVKFLSWNKDTPTVFLDEKRTKESIVLIIGLTGEDYNVN